MKRQRESTNYTDLLSQLDELRNHLNTHSNDCGGG